MAFNRAILEQPDKDMLDYWVRKPDTGIIPGKHSLG
jgi:hypothetical protein